jgi:hypothetical protein
MRVRHARHDLIAERFADPRYRVGKGLRRQIALIVEAGALRARGVPIPPTMAKALALAKPQGAAKFAAVVAELSGRLVAMDRYERHARTRRKRAARAYDAAVAHRGDDRRPASAPLRFPGANDSQN